VEAVDAVGSLDLSRRAFGAQAQERQHLSQIDQSLGLPSFRTGELSEPTLLVEQFLQPAIDALRQAELFQIVRHFKFDRDGLRHVTPFVALDALPLDHKRHLPAPDPRGGAHFLSDFSAALR
jgi:hypothetical protein